MSQQTVFRQLEKINGDIKDPREVQRKAYENEYYTLLKRMGPNPSGRGYGEYLDLLDEFEEWTNSER